MQYSCLIILCVFYYCVAQFIMYEKKNTLNYLNNLPEHFLRCTVHLIGVDGVVNIERRIVTYIITIYNVLISSL